MTQPEPSISIVIPCYNYARYVGGAIESALAQGYENQQIIVVNDGSTDGSLDIIAGYVSRCPGRIQLVDQPNRGSIAAYARGFEQARGDVVIFLDADDVLAPDALRRVARAWSPACAKVQYDVRIIDADGKDLGRRFCNYTPRYDAAQVREAFRRTGTYRWPVTVGNAYSRWFVEAMLPLDVEHGPDGALNTAAPLYGDVVTIAEPLAAYRIHGANLWASDGGDPLRLPYRIRHRRSEERLMRRHAAARGIAVPEPSILDSELAFINYRLMAKKLGLAYEGSGDDSLASLAALGGKLLLEEARQRALPARLLLAHLLWFGVLSGAPRPAVSALFYLRFNRSALFGAWRCQLARVGRALAARTASEPSSAGVSIE
jgi:glycosyltransferase involved in cell wall biosynthesis